jgi:hypothetical protein
VSAVKNLHSLHRHEEELREKSLALIHARVDLSDHLAIVSEAMDVIYAFSHDHEPQSDNELTLQLLGIRLFNAAAASLKLGLSGYYQKAFDQVRDILETYFLVDYLTTHPEKIGEWKAADKRARIAHFGPSFVRNVLDKRDGYTSGERKKVYDLISEYATHASYRGFKLITSAQNLAQIGPFVDDKNLTVWVCELATRLSHAAVILVSHQEGKDLNLLKGRAHYLDAVKAWRKKYFSARPPLGSPASEGAPKNEGAA